MSLKMKKLLAALVLLTVIGATIWTWLYALAGIPRTDWHVILGIAFLVVAAVAALIACSNFFGPPPKDSGEGSKALFVAVGFSVFALVHILIFLRR
jgi:hypothetical protein